ncbi:hypothetical protein [Sphingobium nicotianae]|uniref:Uncharacterized protein n=1 Tax=Sphingobium nicotianae TaxID=2782607 RepID=A0A9X1AI35_9SPHN|nr:hypothetical protein [Sphingobium nicotianae]MBT2185547.1 hypothetical protein [Sphingobium nicotianae]
MGKRKQKKDVVKEAAPEPSSITPIRADVTPRQKNRKKDEETIRRRAHIHYWGRYRSQSAVDNLPCNNLRLIVTGK